MLRCSGIDALGALCSQGVIAGFWDPKKTISIRFPWRFVILVLILRWRVDLNLLTFVFVPLKEGNVGG